MQPATYIGGMYPLTGQPLHADLWRGCVGAWAPCLGPTGLTLYDWSGRKNNGTLTNMDTATDWAVAGGRHSLDFDGSNDRVATGASLIPMTSDFAISCTANVRFATSGCFAAKTNLTSQWDWDFYFSTSTLRFYADGIGTVSSTHTMATGRSHYCVSRQGSTVTFYVNGKAISTGTNSTVLNNRSLPVQIGDEAVRLNGIVESVEIYSRSLTPNEVCLLAQRSGILYEITPRRVARVASAFNRRRRLLIGASS